MIKIKNRVLLTNGGRFADAFNEMGGARNLDTVSKMTMIKLRRQIAEHIKDLQAMSQDMSEEDTENALEDMVSFDLEPIDANIVIDLLTADQLFVLSGTILTEV